MLIAGSNESNFEEDKSSRKRKRKKIRKSEQIQTYGMQILSKLTLLIYFAISYIIFIFIYLCSYFYRHDWKKLRNKYLEEQRKRMHEVKQQLRQVNISQSEKYKSAENEAEDTGMQIEKNETSSECRVQFTPGVIVKLQLEQPVINVKHFKVNANY